MRVEKITSVRPVLCDGPCGLKSTYSIIYNHYDFGNKVNFCDGCFDKLKKALRVKVSK